MKPPNPRKLRPYHRNLYLGVVVHGNKLWLSELLAILFVATLLCVLLTFSAVILANSLKINNQAHAISRITQEKIALDHEIDKLKERRRLILSLNSISQLVIPGPMILHLVELVYQNSMLYGYDPLLVLAVINVESIFDPGARGRYLNGAQSGALGLMQLKFETAQEMARSLNIPLTNKKDLLRPDVNIALGIAYLTRCISMFKSFKLGLMAYNQGPAAIYQNLSEKKPLSIAYYNKVLKSYYTFRELSKTPF